MKKRNLSQLIIVSMLFAIPIGGCSTSEPASVTDGVEQSAIEAYKEQERQIELEGMEDMKLDE